ncbi:CAAX prenyl protease 2 isoform X1 [Equus przewalskii]
MEGTAVAVCEILKYLIIHWKCETAGVSKGTLLEGQLVISIEALNSKHQTNTLHCVTTIASAGSIYGGLVLEKFLKEIQSTLPGFSAKLPWTSKEASSSQDISGVTPFQMTFEVHEKPRILMTNSLMIKDFLHKIVMVHPKIRFNFNVRVNGILSTELFGAKNEPTLNLSNGMALVVNYQHYVRAKSGTTEFFCSRIHPVLGPPVVLFIPDDVAGVDLLGELILTPAAALCPCPKVFSNQLNRISSVSIFLYGPSGLPLISPSREQPPTTVLKDTFCFIDWKKYHLCVVPNLDLNLDRDLVLPDVSYRVECSKEDQSQNMDPQGQTLLLFFFVDFHSGFQVKQMELWGVHTLLTTHLSAILMESHSVVQDSIEVAVDQALEQHHQAVKAHQKLQASLSVAVNSIMSIVTGSTSSSFRKSCFQALQAADTQEFGTKLHKSFHEITQYRFLHHGSCEVKQLLPEKNDAEQSTEDAHENSSLEFLAGRAVAAGGLQSVRVAESRPWALSRALSLRVHADPPAPRAVSSSIKLLRAPRVCVSVRGGAGQVREPAPPDDVTRTSGRRGPTGGEITSLVRAAGPGAMAALGGDGLRLLSVSRPERQPESAALGGPGPGLCCWVSVFSCLSLACSYVGSLYVWKSELPRDHPAVIKRRFTSVLVVSSLSPLCVLLWRELTGIQPGTSLLTLMGFRLEGIFPAALLPLLLTMILFLGPLMQLSMDCPCDLTDGLKVVLAPRSWARCLTDMRWLRNQVIAPLTEELVFRACMLPMLAPCTGLGPAVFTCPLFFGVAHFHHIFEQLRFRQSSVGSIFLSAAFQFSYTAVFGAYTAFLFIRTGHLIGPVLCHSFCNYMGFPAVCAALEHPQRRPLLAGYALGVGLFLLLLQPLTDPKLYGSLPLCVLLERAGDSEAPLCS